MWLVIEMWSDDQFRVNQSQFNETLKDSEGIKLSPQEKYIYCIEKQKQNIIFKLNDN